MDVVLGVQHRITGLRSGVLPFLHLRATPKPLRQHPMKETECRQLPYSHIICGVFATLSCRLPADIPQHTQPSSKAVLFGRTSVSQRDYNQINNAGGRAVTSPTAWEWKREIHTLAPPIRAASIRVTTAKQRQMLYSRRSYREERIRVSECVVS